MEWFAGADTVGVTAGTSTPDLRIVEVEQWLAALANTVQAIPTRHPVAA